MRRFHPLDVLLLGIGVAMALYAVAFAGLVAGRLGTDPAFGLSAVALVIGVGCLGGFLWTLLFDALRRSFPEGEAMRALYVVLIVLLVPLGAILYYFKVARPDRQGVLRP